MIGEPTDPQRRVLAGWLLVALTLALHLWGLYTSNPPDAGGFSFPGLDKIVHVILFALPTWALVRVVPRAWYALVPLALHAPLSEIIQARIVSVRAGDPWDVVADLVGVAVGWWTVRTTARVESDAGPTATS